MASASRIARRPAMRGAVEAAGVPVVAVTARQALFGHARLAHGQTVVIHAAAASAPMPTSSRARPACASSPPRRPRNAALGRELGAEAAIDYRSGRFEDEVRDADAVINLVGGDTQTRSFAVLRRGGRLVSLVSDPDQDLARSHGVDAAFFLVDATTEELTAIASLIDAGKLRIAPAVVLPLADARRARQMLEGQRPRPKGKIVLAAARG